MESRGQYLHGPKDLRTESRPIEAPGPGEVQIAIRATTLCGSDLHYYAHGRNGGIIVREPLCLGHEAAGEIVGVGEGVNNYANGDKIALEMGMPCEKCDLCKRGRYNICPKLRFRGSASAWPHYQGSLQERVNHPAKWVHKYVELSEYLGLADPRS
jgi:L-iditol 2-dehydrogenase